MYRALGRTLGDTKQASIVCSRRERTCPNRVTNELHFGSASNRFFSSSAP